ncbi:MAG: nucleotidyl transferase AbiEii/AbiGii toxin family protein, partial [Pseudomonadota bacterium]
MFYEDVLRALHDHRVRYLIQGGVAVYMHGVPRATGDLDISVDFSKENVEALISALEELGLGPVAPVDPMRMSDDGERAKWREEKHLAALTFQSRDPKKPYREVDVVLANPIDFEEMFERKKELIVDDISIPLISFGDLIEIKK